jgi:hypothetical protein
MIFELYLSKIQKVKAQAPTMLPQTTSFPGQAFTQLENKDNPWTVHRLIHMQHWLTLMLFVAHSVSRWFGKQT